MAAPLGTIPTIEEQNLQMLFSFRSDLWTSPYTYKDAPLRIFNTDIRLPLYKSDTWSASAHIFAESLNLGRTQFRLGEREVFIANSFQNQGGGFGARRDLANGGKLSFFASYATASDMPWGEPRNDYFDGTITYQMAPEMNYSWIFALNQSDNRGFHDGKPFPYFGVVYSLKENVRMTIGFPFFRFAWGRELNWIHTFEVTPFGVNYAARKFLDNGFVFDGRVGLTVRSYLYDSRPDDEDRIYYQEIFVEGAFKKFVTSRTGVTFALGAAVDRRLYESERIYHPDSKVTQLENDFYGRLGLEFNL
ncbi:MAG: hypothetical protein OM95_16885 [Bdellovibrio sp. ArHS]|nr:MAG: hypothetical protein OM95_16885 [Bdellovibrio sp. ArHS]